MSFNILRYTEYGWSDYFGEGNIWETIEDAENAVIDFHETCGFMGIWKIVQTSELHNYSLVA